MAEGEKMTCGARGDEVHSGSTFFGWTVGCCLCGPVDGRTVPIGFCVWLDVADFVGPAPYFAIDVQVNPEAWLVRFSH